MTNETITAWEGSSQNRGNGISARLIRIAAAIEPPEIAHAANYHRDESLENPVVVPSYG